MDARLIFFPVDNYAHKFERGEYFLARLGGIFPYAPAKAYGVEPAEVCGECPDV